MKTVLSILIEDFELIENIIITDCANVLRCVYHGSDLVNYIFIVSLEKQLQSAVFRTFCNFSFITCVMGTDHDQCFSLQKLFFL